MATPDQRGSEPKVHHFRYDATGLRGKRMRLMDDLPTSDSGRLRNERCVAICDDVF